MSVVAIILARGGSVGLPKKNIQPLLGKPLIYYTIKAALESKTVDRVLVSTDCSGIAEVSKQYGAEVPFMRPSHLAQNNSSSESALKHAVEWLDEEGSPTDIIVYLQTTDIFRHKWMIDAVVNELIDNEKVDTSFIVHPTHKKFWKKVDGLSAQRITGGDYLPRQTSGSNVIYREDTGIACATRASVVKEGKRIGNHVAILENEDFNSCIDIHDEENLWLAEQVLREDNGKRYYL